MSLPTIAAPVIGTIETIPPSIASFEPPLIVTPTLEASVIETPTVVAPLPIETPLEPQGQAIVSTSTSQVANPVIETVEQT